MSRKPDSDPLLNNIFKEFNDILRELFDPSSNTHLFQSYILKERNIIPGTVPNQQCSVTNLLDPNSPLLNIKVDFQKYKKTEEVLRTEYPHL